MLLKQLDPSWSLRFAVIWLRRQYASLSLVICPAAAGRHLLGFASQSFEILEEFIPICHHGWLRFFRERFARSFAIPSVSGHWSLVIGHWSFVIGSDNGRTSLRSFRQGPDFAPLSIRHWFSFLIMSAFPIPYTPIPLYPYTPIPLCPYTPMSSMPYTLYFFLPFYFYPGTQFFSCIENILIYIKCKENTGMYLSNYFATLNSF